MGNAPSTPKRTSSPRTPPRSKTAAKTKSAKKSKPVPAWQWELKDGRYQPASRRVTQQKPRPLWKGWEDDNFDWYIMGNKK